MDARDRGLLSELRRDARATNAALGARVGLTEGAVRRRIARLRADGTILRYTIVTRPLGSEGLVLIRCRPGRTQEVVGRIRARTEDLFETSGDFDLAASVERDSMEEFNRAIDELRAEPGVEATMTLIRLTRFLAAAPAGSPRPGPRRRRRDGAKARRAGGAARSRSRKAVG